MKIGELDDLDQVEELDDILYKLSVEDATSVRKYINILLGKIESRDILLNAYRSRESILDTGFKNTFSGLVRIVPMDELATIDRQMLQNKSVFTNKRVYNKNLECAIQADKYYCYVDEDLKRILTISEYRELPQLRRTQFLVESNYPILTYEDYVNDKTN